MAVAQVVGRAGQLEGAGAGDVQQLFGAGAHAHHTAIGCQQALTVGERRLAAFEKQADVFAAAAEAAQATLAARVVGQFEFGLPFRAGRDALANHQHCKCSGRIVCRSRARGLPIGRPDRAGGGYRDPCARYWGLSRTVTVRAVRSWRRRAPYWCRLRTMYTAGI